LGEFATARPVGLARFTLAGAALLPAGITLFFSFNAGGYFAGAPAVAATILGLLLLLRVTLAEDPFAGFTRALVVVAAALGLFVAWTLLSAFWSDAPARAMIEFDRALAYWLALVLFASFPRDPEWIAWALRGLAAVIVIVCAAGFITRTLPELWPLDESLSEARLSYPLTYWNSVGLMAALGLVLCLHLAASEREPRVVRPLAAAALPVLGATLLLTLSRAGIGVAVLGALLYVAVARPRGLPAVLLSAGAPLALAVAGAYDAEALTGSDPTSQAGIDEGGDLALRVGACALVALVLRTAALPLDARLAGVRVAPETRRRLGWGAVGACVVAIAVGAVAVNLPSEVADRWDSFTSDERVGNLEEESRRGRLSDFGNNGRLDQWEVALEGFSSSPVTGEGAGAFQQRWQRDRPDDLKVEDAHSLYLETLAELGLVGLALLLTALLALLAAFAARVRGHERHAYAALLGMGVGWALHAGIDWDWEMPAVTFWLFAVGGLAIAGPAAAAQPAEEGARGSLVPGRFARVAVGVGVLALLVTPALMALSQAHLNTAVDAFKRGDCPAAIDAALASTSAVSVRPQPFELMGYCDVRLGQPELAVDLMRNAISLEPGNWVSHYGLAVVLAAAGRDPRPAITRALELNPRDPLARSTARRFRSTDDPREWRRRALRTRLPIL
jgi:hypothetical protein